MYPRFFEIVAADSGVQTIFGTNPTRVYLFGVAPQDVADPYCVWQTINGTSENNLNARPQGEHYTVQVDVYGKTAKSVREGAAALRYALEPENYVVALGRESRDQATERYRYSFDVDIIAVR